MQDVTLALVQEALHHAGLVGPTGITALGGGEVNDTYLVEVGTRQMVLRVARDQGLTTLKAEARSLALLDLARVPKLIYFDEHHTIDGRMWILESYLPGVEASRLMPPQFYNLGRLLAQVHACPLGGGNLSFRWQFFDTVKLFGDEGLMLHHPDETLRWLIHELLADCDALQPRYSSIPLRLIHSDVTPSNILVNGDEVSLIDWEFSKASDPMCDFSTLYYEDIDYRQGKWRIRITEAEKQALFAGYEAAGGRIDEERIRFWIRFDKLCAASFLYWRIHQSSRPLDEGELRQYQLDYDTIVNSLQR